VPVPFWTTGTTRTTLEDSSSLTICRRESRDLVGPTTRTERDSARPYATT
jgi:hypothetical protein